MTKETINTIATAVLPYVYPEDGPLIIHPHQIGALITFGDGSQTTVVNESIVALQCPTGIE